jgi:dolichyl-phosphate-mannose-protein mannosyltransferase
MDPAAIINALAAATLVAIAAVACTAGPDLTPARFRVLVALTVAVAALVRAPELRVGLPYLGYIDEGHVLHRVTHMLASRTWDPGWYSYPSLLMEAIALAAAVFRVTPAHPDAVYYDIIEPASVIVIGRLIVLACSLGTVALVIGLGSRLLGRRVGVMAGVLTAMLPSLVGRGAIVIVDTPSAFLVLATLYLTLRLQETAGTAAAAVGAGTVCGLAIASKYTAGGVGVAPLLVLAAGRESWTRRARVAVLFAGGVLVGLAIGVPALFLRTGQVVRALRYDSNYYTTAPATVSCLRAALDAREIGPLLVALAAAGVVLLVRAPRARVITLGWLLFAAGLLAMLLRHVYQPYRNVLPIIPFLCIAAAAALAAGARWIDRRRADAIGVLAATGVALAMLVTGVKDYVNWATRTTDTRVVARRWLERNLRPDDRVLVMEELAFLPSELASLPTAAKVVRGPMVGRGLATGDFTHVVVGVPEARTAMSAAWERDLRPRPVLLRVGHVAFPTQPGFWRGNDLAIVVYGAAPAAAPPG